MLKRFVGMALISSTLLAGCVTTTTTQTCAGPICGAPQTTTSSEWPDSHPSSDGGGDPTGAIIAVSALVTAVALTAVLIHRSHNDDGAKQEEQRVAMTDEELRLQRMYAQAHLSARAGRCEAVAAIGKKLERESPDEYERFASDRELASCLPKPEAVSLR